MIFLALGIFVLAASGCGSMKTEPKVEINHKIVGKWSGKAFTGSLVSINFMKDGSVVHSVDGKDVATEKYKVIDDQNVDMETQRGMQYKLKTEFSNNDKTLTVFDTANIKTVYQRE
jgi:hypothetical protein